MERIALWAYVASTAGLYLWKNWIGKLIIQHGAEALAGECPDWLASLIRDLVKEAQTRFPAAHSGLSKAHYVRLHAMRAALDDSKQMAALDTIIDSEIEAAVVEMKTTHRGDAETNRIMQEIDAERHGDGKRISHQ